MDSNRRHKTSNDYYHRWNTYYHRKRIVCVEKNSKKSDVTVWRIDKRSKNVKLIATGTHSDLFLLFLLVSNEKLYQITM